jgi:hypothetical protein
MAKTGIPKTKKVYASENPETQGQRRLELGRQRSEMPYCGVRDSVVPGTGCRERVRALEAF